MPKINLFEMRDGSKFANISASEKDMWTREAVRNIDKSDNYGNLHTYSTCGNYLVFVVKDASGYVSVYECKIERAATIGPDGKQF